MKVMHLIPSLSSGGVEQVVLELCQGMQAHGVENVVVSAGGPMVKAIEEAGAKHYTRPIGKKRPATLLQAWELVRLLRSERPDILHVHSRVPAWVARLALWLLPVKERPVLVSTFHGFYSVNAYSRIMTHGDAVIAVSNSMREHILSNYAGVPAERIHTIPNSVDSARCYPGFSPSAEWMNRWQQEHPELKGKYTLCLAGRITRLKGCTHLSPILAGLLRRGIPAHAVIVGETKRGKEKIRHEIEQAFAAEGLEAHVSWLGHRLDLREVLCVCDVTLSLTLQPESFGKTTLEALALGRPVAGYAHGGVGEQLEQFLPEGMIPVGDTDAMVARLAEWYHTPPSLKQPVGSPYKRQDMIDAHLALYRQILS